MPLRLRFDHRLDRLADALIDAFAAPPASPFAEDVVIVPSLGVGRWLQQRVALRQGVCARLRVDFASRFLWQAWRSLLPGLPERSPFDPDVARWSVLALIESLPDEPQVALLRRFARDARPVDRLAIAEDIARQFERYLAYRRDWLLSWQRGEPALAGADLGPHEPWQRWLWCRLLERLPGVADRHPVDAAVEMLERHPARARAALGEGRVAVLGSVSMSPEQLTLFARLAEHLDVSVFAPDPCRELWDDMLGPAAIARLREQRPDVAWMYDGEPSILGSWGRAQRDAVAQLLGLEERVGIQAEAPFREEPAAFERDGSPAPSMLDALRDAVLVRSDAPWSAVPGGGPDDSIQVHAAHGTMRQAEVLHDFLLECFEALPGLRPDEVAVFCADVDAAADAIGAAFACVPPDRRIPVAFSGRRRRVEPLADALVELLAIAAADAPLAAVAGWLENPAVAAGIGLDEEAIGALVAWLDAAGARRGLDASGGPAKHHWEAAVDRMLLGASTDGLPVVGDLAPVPPPRGDTETMLGALIPVVDVLRGLRDEASSPRSVARWCARARRVVDALFGGLRQYGDAIAAVHEALADLESGAVAEPGVEIDLPGFARALAGRIDPGASGAVASGSVTVCPIGGLRGVPFRVVCLFGFDEDAFPRRAPAGELDLMLRAPRFGDGVSRLDDRGVFLDALLAARDRVIVLYAGRDPRDDATRSPSVLVSELIDYVATMRPGFAVVRHPLHPFSPRAFAGETASRAAQWIETARALAVPLARRPEAVGAVAGPEPAPAAEAGRVVLSARDVVDALADPARAWLRHALGVRLPPQHLAIEPLEPLWPDRDRDRALVDEAAARLLDGAVPGDLEDALRAAPQTAGGPAGEVHARRIVDEAGRLVDAALEGAGVSLAAPPAVEAVEFTFPAEDGHPELVLQASVGQPSEGDSVALATGFPLGAQAVIRAWLAHAVRVRRMADLGADPERLVAASTFLAAPDGSSVTVRGDEPARLLAHAVRSAWRVRREALPLFPRTSLEHHRRGDEGRALDVLHGDGRGNRVAEIERPWAAALHRDAEPGLDAVLEAGAAIYGPIFGDCEVVERRSRRQ